MPKLFQLPRLRRRRPPAPPTCFECGYRDSQLKGWYDSHSGTLAPGFPIGPEDVFVDVGCGRGGAAMFAARRRAEVFVTDIDPEALACATAKLQESPARQWQALQSDSDPLPLPDGLATRVVSMEVLEHVADPQRFVSELVRIGQPGCLYLITVPDAASEAIQRQIAPDTYWQPPNHLRVFESGAVEALLTAAGLVVEQRSSKSFFWAVWWMLFWAADQDLREPEGPLLHHWTQTWHTLLDAPGGRRVRDALDEFLPKSRVFVARKPPI